MRAGVPDRGVWLIANPIAGRKGGLLLNPIGPEEARAALERHGLAPELHVTARPGHATLLARQAVAAGADLVVAAGGDGTVHEVAAALIQTPGSARGHSTTLAILPLGSMMNLARALGIPRDLDAAAATIAQGRVLDMDVGLVRTAAAESFFLEAAGLGRDAGVFAYGSQLDGGKWRYLLPFLRFLARYRPRPARVEVDGRPVTVPRALMISVAISPYIGLALTLAPDAKLDDRHFDVVVRQGEGRLDILLHGATMLLGAHPHSGRATTLRGRRVSIDHSHGPMPVHADGVLVGRTPAEFELLPGALPIVAAPLAGGATSAPPEALAGRPVPGSRRQRATMPIRTRTTP
jgi:diacylglycerol kinase (ATP)